MSTTKFNNLINDLFQRGEWEKARCLLEMEREKDPESHWLLTQLGVTFYEQGKYEKALRIFLASRKIVDDCPLTLWNLAATLEALGKYTVAVKIFTWLLETEKSAAEDPCWESKEWTNALKTDCVIRLGVCFKYLGKTRKAEHCYRQYLNLLLSGFEGLYSPEEVFRRIRDVHNTGDQRALRSEWRKAVASTLQALGVKTRKGRANGPPRFDEKELLYGRRAASKK
jgi:tetratricopeptide (TPR) repeat protein